MKAYVLTAEGYFEGYGSETYLLGVFTDLDKLSAAKNNHEQLVKATGGDAEIKAYHTKVTEVELDAEYPSKPYIPRNGGHAYKFVNGKFLGGYREQNDILKALARQYIFLACSQDSIS